MAFLQVLNSVWMARLTRELHQSNPSSTAMAVNETLAFRAWSVVSSYFRLTLAETSLH